AWSAPLVPGPIHLIFRFPDAISFPSIDAWCHPETECCSLFLTGYSSARGKSSLAEAGKGRSQVVGVDALCVALVHQVAEDNRVDGVGDGPHRAVSEHGVEPAGVRRAEALGPVVVPEVVWLGPLVGRARGVQIPAAGVADGVGLLRLSQESQVHALV